MLDFDTWAADKLADPFYSGLTREELRKSWDAHMVAPVARPPAVKPAEGSDFVRGLTEPWQQLPQLGWGAVAGVGATIESVMGEGGIGTGLKRRGVEGYKEWEDKISAKAKDTDSFTTSWERATNGDPGALANWLAHGFGYVLSQGAQAIGTAGLGSVGLKAAAKNIAERLIAKEVARITEAAGGKVAAEAATAQATKAVTEKISRIGSSAALGGLATGQEGGEIFGEMISSSPDKVFGGDELGRAFMSTLAAGGLEFVGDRLGLDIVTGRSALGRGAATATGVGGRVARGALAGGVAAPVEGGTEYLQTLIEEFGKGNDPFSDESMRHATDAAALGVLGGGGIGAAVGAVRGPKTPEQVQKEEKERQQIAEGAKRTVAGQMAVGDLKAGDAAEEQRDQQRLDGVLQATSVDEVIQAAMAEQVPAVVRAGGSEEAGVPAAVSSIARPPDGDPNVPAYARRGLEIPGMTPPAELLGQPAGPSVPGEAPNRPQATISGVSEGDGTSRGGQLFLQALQRVSPRAAGAVISAAQQITGARDMPTLAASLGQRFTDRQFWSQIMQAVGTEAPMVKVAATQAMQLASKQAPELQPTLIHIKDAAQLAAAPPDFAAQRVALQQQHQQGQLTLRELADQIALIDRQEQAYQGAPRGVPRGSVADVRFAGQEEAQYADRLLGTQAEAVETPRGAMLREPRMTQAAQAVEALKAQIATEAAQGGQSAEVASSGAASTLRAVSDSPSAGVAMGRAVLERLGARVVIVDNDGPEGVFNGVTEIKGAPGVVFLHARTKRPALAVMGHELFHTLPDSLKKKIYAVVVTMFGEAKIAKAMEDRGWTREKAIEELTADLVGNRFMERSFWKMLEHKAPSAFREFAQRAMEVLGRIIEAMKSGLGLFGVDEGLSSSKLRRARVVIADVLAEHARALSPQEQQRLGWNGKDGFTEGGERARVPENARGDEPRATRVGETPEPQRPQEPPRRIGYEPEAGRRGLDTMPVDAQGRVRRIEESTEDEPAARVAGRVDVGKVNRNPTDGQKEAGNYQKGHINFEGNDLSIENDVGSVRRGKDENGEDWEVEMTAHYGYRRRTKGKDGEQIDGYLAPNPIPGAPVFVFDQYNLTGKRAFDEHKFVMGVATRAQAEEVYDAHFSDGSGPKRRQGMRQMTMAEFRAWADDGTRTKKPVAPRKGAFYSKEEPVERGVLAEVAPNPQSEEAKDWREMTAAEREQATRSVVRRVVGRVFDEMGLKGWRVEQSTGRYQGETNPNFIIAAPDGASIAQIEELARVVGYVFDQQAMVAFDEHDTGSDAQAGFVKVTPPDGMSAEQVRALREHIGAQVPQADGDTLRDGALVFGNFSAFNDGVETIDDQQYREAIRSAVETFEFDGGTIDVSQVRQFHSQLIWPDSRDSYLEGTRYGKGKGRDGEAGRDVRGQGRVRLEALASEADDLRQRWIATRSAARGRSREDSGGAPRTEPEVEYGEPRDGAVSAVGVHFSQQRRSSLQSIYHGTGLRGAESDRLKDAANRDIRNRIYFYVDTGNGVQPEPGVGGVSHAVLLKNLYDANADSLGLSRNVRSTDSEERASKFERAVKDAGFDGYLWKPGGQQGFAVLIGDHTIRFSQEGKSAYSRDDPEKIAGKAIKYLTPQERSKLRRDTASRLVEIMDELPSSSEFAAIAFAGRANRGWYKRAAEALTHVFGLDSVRFAALLAATSPQTSVKSNFANAVSIWANWVEAGRPTSRNEIIKIMGRSVLGNKLNDSILPAWINNTVDALTTEDPEALIISGPKVNSFMLNLRGFVNEVTNDAWMAAFAAVDQRLFAGKRNKSDGGKGSGYMAMSARVRQAAERLTFLTGEAWTPVEVQETVWAWTKALYEAQDSGIGAREILDEDGGIDFLVAASPDFRTLFTEPKYEQVLRQAGYGERLDSLPLVGADHADAGAQSAPARREAAPFTPDAQKRHERRAANRLERLRDDRAAGTISYSQEFDEFDYDATDPFVQDLSPDNFSGESIKPDKADYHAARRWLEMAQDKRMFAYPVSDQMELENVAWDVAKLRTTAWRPADPIERVDKAKKVALVKLPKRKDGDSAAAKVMIDGRKHVWINAMSLRRGAQEGSAIYSIVANYAHNNGLVFIGDPAGLSDDALFRRTEQMLASALKFGTTDHLAPHERQTDAGLAWRAGDTEHNIAAMLAFTRAKTLEFTPKLQELTLNPKTGTITDPEGNELDNEALNKLLRADKDDAPLSRAGSRTAKRALATEAFRDEYERGDRDATGELPAKMRGVSYSVEQPKFFSQLKRAVDGAPAKLGNMTGEQWQLWLDSNKSKIGVKSEEIEWTGLREYLAMRGDEKLSRDDVSAHLSDNAVQVRDVVLPGELRGFTKEDQERLNELENNRNRSEDEDAEFQRLISLENAANDGNDATPAMAKFTDPKWRVPGGTNYREILLTLPPSPIILRWDESRSNPEGISKPRINKYVVEVDGKAHRFDTREEADTFAKKHERTPFERSHWDQQNVLLHMRVDDRTDADGNKVLFINELQSDWGQKGRDEGFSGDEVRRLKLGRVEKDPIIFKDDPRGARRGQWEYIFLDESGTGYSGFGNTEEEARENLQRSGIMRGSGIPRGPFVQKTESWVALGLKRAIMLAVQGGYDKVAIATGQQAADYFDLSKDVKHISWHVVRNEDGTPSDVSPGTRMVIVRMASDVGQHLMFDINADGIVTDSPTDGALVGKRLDAIIGKEPADRIMASEKGKLSGDGLKVGGEGMRAFYPNADLSPTGKKTKDGADIFPVVHNVANDVLKRLGGGKVGVVQIRRNELDMGEIKYTDDHAQPGFSITPEMRERVGAGVALFSKELPDWIASGPAALQSAAGKVDTFAPQKTMREKAKAMSANWKERLIQGIFDQFAPLKRIDMKSYILARMTKSSDGVLEGMLLYGLPKMDAEGAIYGDLDHKGFLGAMQELNGEHDRFMLWVAGNRSERLMGEEREHLFTKNEVVAMRALNQGQMRDGSSRETAYLRAQQTLSSYNKAVLDIAEKAGLIDAESRATWEHEFYVPFFRVDDDMEIAGPAKVKGLVRQRAFQRLKGGKENLGDLMHNTLRNWSHLISASLANNAARSSLESAERAGVAIEATGAAAQEMAKSMGKKGSAVYFMDEGKQRWFVVDDPYVLDAISSLEAAPLRGLPMEIMSKFKHVLTAGVTISPIFKVRNLMRDSVAAIGQNPVSYNMGRNVLQGWAATAKSSDEYAQMLFGGAMMRFGTYLDGNHAEHAKRLINKGIPDQTILDTREKIRDAGTALWDWWQEFGDRMENVNRAAIYKQLRDDGVSHLEASYRARDSMDFSLQGSFTAMRILTQVIPFLNARAQGLYKLGRATKEDPARMAAVAGAVVLASWALLLAYNDDDDWKAREDWDRDNFWWFKIGGTAYRIPKPFEIGAIGTIAERSLEYAMNEEMTGKRFAERMRDIVTQTFEVNPIPQMFKPMVDIYANWDSFSNRVIETPGMERHSKAERVSANTSMVARLLGRAGDFTGLSPVQIDHLVRAYAGWMGVQVVNTVDLMARPFSDIQRPAPRLEDVFFVGGFAKELPERSSRYLEEFYRQSVAIKEVMADIKTARELGDIEKAKALETSEAWKVQASKLYSRAERQLAQINKRVRIVTASPHMSGEDKRMAIDGLTQQRNTIAKLVNDQALQRQKALTQ